MGKDSYIMDELTKLYEVGKARLTKEELQLVQDDINAEKLRKRTYK